MARRNQRPSDVSERMTGRRVLRLDGGGRFLIGDLEGDHLGGTSDVRPFSITAPDAPRLPTPTW
jgi:hypothetical protein